MAAINSWLEGFLPDLLRSQDTRIHVPTVPPAFSDVGAMVTIDIGRREPSRAAALIHVDAVVIVSEFERVAVLFCVRSHSCGVLLHFLANARQRHVDGLEEAWIV